MPVIGFGTYAGTDTPEQVYAATKVGLQTGYRHFDTARICKCMSFVKPKMHA